MWYRCDLEDENRLISVTIDVMVDPKGIVNQVFQFFGYYRDNEEDDSSPLSLNYDGTIDWGSQAPEVSTLDIRGKRLARGEKYAYVMFNTKAALARREAAWQVDLTLMNYRNLLEA